MKEMKREKGGQRSWFYEMMAILIGDTRRCDNVQHYHILTRSILQAESNFECYSTSSVQPNSRHVSMCISLIIVQIYIYIYIYRLFPLTVSLFFLFSQKY